MASTPHGRDLDQRSPSTIRSDRMLRASRLLSTCAQKFIALINTPGETVAGRFGPDQTAVIEASTAISPAGVVDHVQDAGSSGRRTTASSATWTCCWRPPDTSR